MFEKKYSLPNTEHIRRPPNSELRETEDFPMGSPIRDLFREFLPKGEQIALTEAFAVSRDSELGYTRFIRGKEDKVEFELIISDEANEILRDSGKVETKKEVIKEIKRVIQDPYGESSIDHYVNVENEKHRKIYRSLRSVNALSSELETKLQTPLAIKGSAILPPEHKDREDLIEQFRFMKQKEKEWQQAPEYIKEILSIAKVYAAMRYKVPDEREYEEWLIMQRVLDAKKVEDNKLSGNMFFDQTRGFNIEEHPRLAEIVDTQLDDHKKLVRLSKDFQHCYRWSDLERALQSVGLKFSDLVGRNTLYSENQREKRHYILIDQRDRSKEY